MGSRVPARNGPLERGSRVPARSEALRCTRDGSAAGQSAGAAASTGLASTSRTPADAARPRPGAASGAIRPARRDVSTMAPVT